MATTAARLKIGIRRANKGPAQVPAQVPAQGLSAQRVDRWVVVLHSDDSIATLLRNAQRDPLGVTRLGSANYRRSGPAAARGAFSNLQSLAANGWLRIVPDEARGGLLLEANEIVLAAIAAARGERVVLYDDRTKAPSLGQGAWGRDIANLEVWIRYCLRLSDEDKDLLLFWYLEPTLSIENLDEMLGTTAALLRGGVYTKLQTLGCILFLDGHRAKRRRTHGLEPSAVVYLLRRWIDTGELAMAEHWIKRRAMDEDED